jgi:hypothetical protein
MPRQARCAPTGVPWRTNFGLFRPICVVIWTFLRQERDRATVEGTSLHVAGYSGRENTKLAGTVACR